MAMSRDLTCPVCAKIFENPLALPCLHGVCQTCLEVLAASTVGGSAAIIHCPTPGCGKAARIPEEGVQNFPVHFYIKQQIEAAAPAATNNEDVNQSYCTEHNSMMAYYCDSCNKARCPGCVLHKCQLESHHHYDFLSIKYQEHLSVVSAMKDSVYDRKAAVQESLNKASAVQEDVQCQKDEVLDEMQTFFKNSHEMLTNMEMLYTSQINSLSASHRDACLQAKQPKEKLLNDITRQLNNVEKIIESSSVEEFLTAQKRVNVMAQLQELSQCDLGAVHPPPQVKLRDTLPSVTVLHNLFPSSIGSLAAIDDLPKASFAGEPKLNQINYVFYQSANTAVPGGLDVSMTLTGQEVDSTQKVKIPLVQVNAGRQYLVAYVPSIRGHCQLEFSEKAGGNVTLSTYMLVSPLDLRQSGPVCSLAVKSKVVAVARDKSFRSLARVYADSKQGIAAYKGGNFKAVSRQGLLGVLTRNFASGLVVSNTGAVYQSITVQNTIVQFVPASTTGLIPLRSLKPMVNTVFSGLTGLAICANTLFVCDTHCYHLFDLELRHLGTYGTEGIGPGQFRECVDIAIDPTSMNVYIADTGNSRIHVSSFNHAFIQCIACLSDPRGVCINKDYLYVTELGASRISVFTLDGVLVTRIGEGHLQSPYGIDVDQDGFVWVCDWGKEKIFVF